MRKQELLFLAVGFLLICAVGAGPGIPGSVWSLKGNRGTQPSIDYLGTADEQPLQIKTNGSSAITVGATTPIEIHRESEFRDKVSTDKDVSIGTDLAVARSIGTGTLDVRSDARVQGNLTVDGTTRTAGLEAQALAVKELRAGTLEVEGHSTTRTLAVREHSTFSSIAIAGTTTTGVLEITGGDLAEPFLLPKAVDVPVGSVTVIDDRNPGRLTLTSRPYDRRVVGIVSGAGGIQPGVILYREATSPESRNVALAGRVYALADATEHSIRPGDLLTTSSRRGHVMKVIDHGRAQGAIVGKAMSALDSGTGQVLVLVSLQ